MAKYSYITDKTHNDRKIQVESAKRDGSGKNIENNYAKQNGNYQSLTAGLSNNFDTKQVMVDESAYNFRPTASMGSMELEVGSPCKVKKIVGGSVAFNQLIKNGNFASVSEWVLNSNTTYSVSDNVATIINTSGTYNGIYQNLKIISGHKYLLLGSLKVDEATTGEEVSLSINAGSETQRVYVSGTNWNNMAIISNGGTGLYPYAKISLDFWENKNVYAKNIVLFDLTQMFGSTIADYIYSLEQANAGSGVAWFKRYLPKEYYAYNSGELVSVKTQGKKITHFNQWDEEWELGKYNTNTGAYDSDNSRICSKHTAPIPVFPSTQYYIKSNGTNWLGLFEYDDNDNFVKYTYVSGTGAIITTQKETTRFRFMFDPTYGTTYNHDICINFHYDGERDGEYEPYNSETYPCDDIELRGIPQLDENNNLAFDGDEYANDGNVTRKYGIVDLGTLTWTYSTPVGANPFWHCPVISGIKPVSTYNDIPNIVGEKYLATICNNIFANREGISVLTDGRLCCNNGSSTTSPTGYLIYELATPTDENSIPFTEVQECDNWGTEEWLAPTTDTRPCEVPVGHETDYLPDLKAKLEVAPTTPNENGVYVMEHNASGNSYTPIATWLTDNGYVKSTDVANGYGTKDALGGTLRQLLAITQSVDFLNTDYVDLGSLTWEFSGSTFRAIVSGIVLSSTTHIICPKYKTSTGQQWGDMQNLEIGCLSDIGQIRIRDDSAGTDANAFKNAMKGILLAYEKAS